MKNETQEIRLVDFHNRYVDLKVEGTWGYNPNEYSILTKESYIEELEVNNTKVIDNNGEILSVPLLMGVDKYGRYLEIPIDKIIAVGWLDTNEQASLKSLKSIADMRNDIDFSNPNSKVFKEMIDKYDSLIEKGVKPYRRINS